MARSTWILFSDLEQPFLLDPFKKSCLSFWVFCSTLPGTFSEPVFPQRVVKTLHWWPCPPKDKPTDCHSRLAWFNGRPSCMPGPEAVRPRATQRSNCRPWGENGTACLVLFHFLTGGFSSLICFSLVVYYFIFLGGWNQHVWALVTKRRFIRMDWLQWTSLAIVWDKQGFTLVLWKNSSIQNYQGLVIFWGCHT